MYFVIMSISLNGSPMIGKDTIGASCCPFVAVNWQSGYFLAVVINILVDCGPEEMPQNLTSYLVLA